MRCVCTKRPQIANEMSPLLWGFLCFLYGSNKHHSLLWADVFQKAIWGAAKQLMLVTVCVRNCMRLPPTGCLTRAGPWAICEGGGLLPRILLKMFMRIKCWPPPPTPEFLSEAFCLHTKGVVQQHALLWRSWFLARVASRPQFRGHSRLTKRNQGSLVRMSLLPVGFRWKEGF